MSRDHLQEWIPKQFIATLPASFRFGAESAAMARHTSDAWHSNDMPLTLNDVRTGIWSAAEFPAALAHENRRKTKRAAPATAPAAKSKAAKR